jgi:hypothetical protein
VRQGLYRLNVVPGDATELIVRKGRVILSDSPHTKVKGGNKVVFSATAVSVAKLTKEEKKLAEEVDVWSKQRAETLAKANRRITDRMFTSAFASWRDSDPFTRNRTGLWFYNAGAGCYTFLPFFYGFTSPYGNSYSTSIYSPYWYPGRGYGPNQPTAGGNNWPTGGTTQGPTGGTPTGAAPTGGTRPVYSAPPQSSPRMIDPDTGNRMPRKNIELPSRPGNN